MFVHVVTDHAVRAKGASELMEEYMDASNFGVGENIYLSYTYFCELFMMLTELIFFLCLLQRDNFSSLLDRLLTSLKLDLQQYRVCACATSVINSDTSLPHVAYLITPYSIILLFFMFAGVLSQ